MIPLRLAYVLILYFLACGLALTIWGLSHPQQLDRVLSLPRRTHAPTLIAPLPR